MKPAARGLFFVRSCAPPQKKCKKYPQNICLFEKYMYICIVYIINQVPRHRIKVHFFMHIYKAIAAAFHPVPLP